MLLKKAIGFKLPYKDVRGEWWIYVNIGVDSVVVKHLKREQSWTTKVGEGYKFTWEFKIIFNREINQIIDTCVMIKEVSFDDAATLEYRKSILEIMKEFYPIPVTNV